MFVRHRRAVAACLLVASVVAARAEASDPVAALLRQRDESLLRAVHEGGRKTWSDLTTPDFVYVEEGEATPRAVFLAGLDPDGQPPLVIVDYTVSRTGDTAIVMHTDTVPGPVPPGREPGRYLMTETWQRIGGDWKLRLVHVDAIRAMPPMAEVPPARLAAWAGTYRSDGATAVVAVDGAGLSLRRANRPTIALQPESADVFVNRKDLRRRFVFLEAHGELAAQLISRDENSERVWIKGPAER